MEDERISLSQKYHNLHWDPRASYWDLLGSPLRPSEEDIRIMEQAVLKWSRKLSGRSLKAVLWGVTPEIATMGWPERTYLLAADQATDMIHLVWPGDIAELRKAARANWLHLPVLDSSVHAVIGDGSFNQLDYPEGYRLLAQSARRVLRNEGILLMRFYVRPEECEEPEDVFRDMTAGRIKTFDGFRLRLLMAVQGNNDSVRLDDVWQVWEAAKIDIEALMSITGWRKEVVQTVKGYQGKDARFAFPTLQETRGALSEWFLETEAYFPGYQLGDRCPILLFRPF